MNFTSSSFLGFLDDISCHNTCKESGMVVSSERILAGRAWEPDCRRDLRAALRISSIAKREYPWLYIVVIVYLLFCVLLGEVECDAKPYITCLVIYSVLHYTAAIPSSSSTSREL